MSALAARSQARASGGLSDTNSCLKAPSRAEYLPSAIRARPAPPSDSCSIALVTGATSPIGCAIATALAREGAKLLLTDFAPDRGPDLAAEMRSQGYAAHYIDADLNQADSAIRVFQEAEKHFGSISVFVHCASPNHFGHRLFKVTDEAWDTMMAVVIHAAHRLGRLAGDHMRQNGIEGRMLFITSLHAHTPRMVPHYSVAKAGLEMLVKEFARALGPFGIRVNALAPGMISDVPFSSQEMFLRATPMGRIGGTQDVAGTAVALLSNRFSGFVTGITVAVDGGLSLSNWIADDF